MAQLHNLNADIHTFGKNLENAIITALRHSITQGIVVRSFPTEDAHNPNDRLLEILVHINLSNIDKQLSGLAEIKTVCRLSVATGTLTVRNIQRNFQITGNQNDDEDDIAGSFEDDGRYYDNIDYDDRE